MNDYLEQFVTRWADLNKEKRKEQRVKIKLLQMRRMVKRLLFDIKCMYYFYYSNILIYLGPWAFLDHSRIPQ